MHWEVGFTSGMRSRKTKTIEDYYNSAIKTSITMPRRWFETGCGRQQMLGCETFSDYVQRLVREDVMGCGMEIPLHPPPKHLGVKAGSIDHAAILRQAPRAKKRREVKARSLWEIPGLKVKGRKKPSE